MSGDGDEFGARYWEERYRGHAAHGRHDPSPQLVAEVEHLPTGVALDAGCGEGRNALWLAGRGWRVTAVDVSATALGRARNAAEELGADVVARVAWVEADLTTWAPTPGAFDLVTAHYVHPSGSRRELLDRLADGVAPGGMLLVVDHDDSDQRAHTHVSVDELSAGLDADAWDIEVAERRERDVVLRARRRTT